MSEIFDTAKEIGSEIIKPVVNNKLVLWKKYWEDKAIIKGFSPELLDKNETSTLDYYLWHDNENDLDLGSGIISSITYKEVEILWSQINLCAVYEAFLLNHLQKGGRVSRIFIAGEEIVNPITRMLFLKSVFRHKLLGFNPRIVSISDMGSLKRELNVRCDMFGNFNNRVAYYFQFPRNQYPRFIKTIKKSFVNKAVKCHKELLNRSEDFDVWLSRLPMELSNNDKKEVELIVDFITLISNQRNKNV